MKTYVYIVISFTAAEEEKIMNVYLSEEKAKTRVAKLEADVDTDGLICYYYNIFEIEE